VTRYRNEAFSPKPVRWRVASHSGESQVFAGKPIWTGNEMTTIGKNPCRTLSSRTVYSNSWLALREDKAIREHGGEGIYSAVDLRPSCGIVAINEHNQIALVGQWRDVHDKYSLEVPTGGVEQGETPLAAAKRELLEETGLTARDWSTLGTIDISNGASTDVAHLFLARNLTAGSPGPQRNGQLELRWMPFADAVLAVMSGEITESGSVAAILRRNFWGGKF
jgi:8-oxo-dGTP pyrophosphatase MutT (NUDIX family)